MTLFLTPDELKTFAAISDSVETEFVEKFLIPVQSMYIVPILGIALSTEIENQIQSGTTSASNQILLDDWIKPAMAFKSWEQSVPFLSMKAFKRSLVKPAGVDTTALTLDEIKFYRQNISDIAVHYLQGLLDFLDADSSTPSPIYPLYRVSGDNEQRTQASNSNGIYFKRKLNPNSNTGYWSYPDQWYWGNSYWNLGGTGFYG